MDEDQIHHQVKKCKHLKFKIRGVYAADNYPLSMQTNTFVIVNASRSNSIGTHWVVLAKRYAYPIRYFSDPLALPLTTYKDIFNRLQQCTDLEIMMDIMEHRRDIQSPLQSSDSQLCGLFCIYIVHYFYSEKFPFIPDVNELELLAFKIQFNFQTTKLF